MAMFKNVNVAPIDTSGFERAGAAYGQMFQNLGNTVAHTLEKYRDKKLKKENLERETSFWSNQTDPQTGMLYDPDEAKALATNPDLAKQKSVLDQIALQAQQFQDQFELEKRQRELLMEQSAEMFGRKTDLADVNIVAAWEERKRKEALHPGVLAQQKAGTELTEAQTSSIEFNDTMKSLGFQFDVSKLRYTIKKDISDHNLQLGSQAIAEEANRIRKEESKNRQAALRGDIAAKKKANELAEKRYTLEAQKSDMDWFIAMGKLGRDVARHDVEMKISREELKQQVTASKFADGLAKARQADTEAATKLKNAQAENEKNGGNLGQSFSQIDNLVTNGQLSQKEGDRLKSATVKRQALGDPDKDARYNWQALGNKRTAGGFTVEELTPILADIEDPDGNFLGVMGGWRSKHPEIKQGLYTIRKKASDQTHGSRTYEFEFEGEKGQKHIMQVNVTPKVREDIKKYREFESAWIHNKQSSGADLTTQPAPVSTPTPQPTAVPVPQPPQAPQAPTGIPASSPFTGANPPSMVVTREGATQGQLEAQYPELFNRPSLLEQQGGKERPPLSPEEEIQVRNAEIQQWIGGWGHGY